MEDGTVKLNEMGETKSQVNMKGTDPSNKRKKKRLQEGITVEDLLEGWTQCCYFIKNKRRLCNIGRSPGSIYCGNHRSESDIVPDRVLKDARDAGVATIERIPCPIDPTHDIFSHNLEAHIKICNTGTRYALLHQKPYYCKDCNTGTNEPMTLEALEEVNVDQLVDKIRACFHNQVDKGIQEPTPDNHCSPYISEEDIVFTLSGCATSFDKVRHAQQNVRIAREMESSGLLCSRRRGALRDQHYTVTSTSSNDNGGSSSGDGGAVEEPPVTTTYVELGAGKGALGLAVVTAFLGVAKRSQPVSHGHASQTAVGKDESAAGPASAPSQPPASAEPGRCPHRSRLVLVERMGVKKKADKTLREQFSDTVGFERVRMDIRDCLLSKLPDMPPPPMTAMTAPGGVPPSTCDKHDAVLIAKHLCGLATDITLRSLLSYVDGAHVLSDAVRGVAIATCCHHACAWKDYVATEWLVSQGFTSAEFELMTHWSGWAHTIKAGLRLPQKRASDAGENDATDGLAVDTKEGDDDHSNIAEHFENGRETSKQEHYKSTLRRPALSYEDMSVVGKMIKRILDQGRVEFLRNLGLSCAVQRRYCDPELSPECYLILATRE